MFWTVAGPEGLLLFSSHKQIRAYFLNSGVYYPVAKDLHQVTGVAYDGQHVYWTNVFHDEESIMRSLEDGSEQEVIITAGEPSLLPVIAGSDLALAQSFDTN